MFEREDNTERFFVSGEPADDEVAALGFRWLGEYAREHGHSEAALVVPGLRSLDSLARVIGAGAAKRLHKDRRVVSNGLTIGLYTETKPPWSLDGPVLAVWTRDKSLEKLDTTGAAAICAAPWMPDKIADWRANWSPVDVRSGTADESGPVVGNPVVARALEWLTVGANVGTGLADPQDRSSAIHMFRMLRDGGEPYVPDEVRVWAVRHGWAPEDARELATIAQKILDRRGLRADASGGWRSDALEQIRREVAEAD